jgi:hypothetical protein
MSQPLPDHASTDYEKLVRSWIKYHEDAVRRGGEVTGDDENFWAFEMMLDLCRIDPEAAWEVIQRIVDRAEDPGVLACVGSGPLEDLLTKHGNEFIERVVAEIRANAKFANVAESMWPNRISPDVWDTVQTALQERG